jgi:PAS domain S-box-containing protein
MVEKKKTIQHKNNSDFQQSNRRSKDKIALLQHAEKINETLFEISNAVNTTLNLDDLYRSIHDSLARIVDVANFFIAIVDSKKRTLHFPYHVDTTDDDFVTITDFDTDSSLTGLVVLQRKPVLIEKKALEDRAAKGGVWGPVPLIWMGIPLIVKDTVIGVMALQSYTDPNLYDHHDLQVLTAVSHQIAIAIDRKHSVEARKKSEETNRILFEISNSVSTTENLFELYESIHRSLARVIDVTNFYISIVDSKKRTLHFPYHVDTMGENFTPITDFDTDSSLTGLVVSRRKPILLRKKELEALAAKGSVKGLGRSIIWMGSPLIVNDTVIGIMVALSYNDPDLYDQNDLDIIGAVSEQVAIAIHRKQSEEARKKSEETNKILFEISNAVNTTLDLEDLYRSIHGSLARIIDVTNFFIAIVDMKKHTLHFPYHVDTVGENFTSITDFETDSSLTGLVVLQREPVLIEKKALEDRAAKGGIRGPVPVIWMGIPLILKDTVIGVVALQSYTDPNLYDHHDLQILSAVSHQIAMAIGRKQSHDELQHSEARLKAILESSPDPIVVYDIQGHPQYLNPAFAQVFGWSIDELKGKRIPYVPDDQKEKLASANQQLLSTLKPVRFETQRLTKQGDLLDILVCTGPIMDIDDKPAGFVVTLTDITERNRLTAQFHAAQKLESIGTLAGGIAHDFNNLLTGILGHVSLMMAENGTKHYNTDHLKGIESYAKDATDLTKRLLGFARGGKFEVKPTNINDLVEKQTRMFSRTKKEIRIHCKYEKNIQSVEVDRGQFEQVIMNLYVNAWQAMPDGGDLYVQTDKITNDDTGSQSSGVKPRDYVHISVRDTGIGMDDSTRRRIFDPFFTTKEMGRGTGLGLASVYGIIKNHGGFINVHSRKGHGSTFNIYLPLSDKRVIDESDTSVSLIRGSETILLVDDESVIVDVGKKMLEKLGHQVIVARKGKEAVDIYRKEKDKIDLVILDMIMPEWDGGKTFDELTKINPDVKVLLSSGYSVNGLAQSILDRGCKGFIQKPFSMNELSQQIRKALAGD